MRWAFWLAVGVIAYTYVGYLAWLWVRAQWRPRAVKRAAAEPLVSVVMVVRNEETVLAEKLRNLLALDYPPEHCQIVVVSDGSTDGTQAILREYARNPQVHVMLNQLAGGKASGLNDGMSVAQGDVVVFTDARQTIEPGAIRLLMENFADPEVGAVCWEMPRTEKPDAEWDCTGGSRSRYVNWRLRPARWWAPRERFTPSDAV